MWWKSRDDVVSQMRCSCGSVQTLEKEGADGANALSGVRFPDGDTV